MRLVLIAALVFGACTEQPHDPVNWLAIAGQPMPGNGGQMLRVSVMEDTNVRLCAIDGSGSTIEGPIRMIGGGVIASSATGCVNVDMEAGIPYRAEVDLVEAVRFVIEICTDPLEE
jgi:hypothetical protein